MKILRQIKIKTKLSTKEFTISKKDKIFVLDFVSWGDWVTFNCNSLKDCFNIIRRFL